MDLVPIYQIPNSRDSRDFHSTDMYDGAIDTANRYIQERIDPELKNEARIEALEELASELAMDAGNIHIVRAIRERISIEKSDLEMRKDNLFV